LSTLDGLAHPAVVSRLREWFETKKSLFDNTLLFPISNKVPGGVDRRTSKMMRLDLKAARKKWIEEGKTDKEKAKREETDFLKYKNDAGLFADFHSNRHTFITNLERSGVSPRRAQSLARHSDIRLTMGVYTHINLHDQSSAIESLPAPPTGKVDGKVEEIKPNGIDLKQLDAMWGMLSDDIKARILTLANAAS
jgi:integrase